MNTHRRGKVLLIALDAADATLVERLIGQGKLPNLSRLRDESACGSIRSIVDWFVAAPWPTFYSGSHPAEHGIYHYLPWNPDTMANEPMTADRFRKEPFWRDFQAQGLETIVIDAPMVHPPPRRGCGAEICGWYTHDFLTQPWAYPENIREWLDTHGYESRPVVETQRPMTRKMVTQLVDVLNATTCNIRDLSIDLLNSRQWDFALVSFTATHVAGHQLWGESSLDPRVRSHRRETMEEALTSVYMACDQAVGQLIETVDDDVTIMLMSLHGFEANTSRGELLPSMLRLVLTGRDSVEKQSFRMLSALRESVPRRWRHAVKRRLPSSWQRRLTGLWRTGGSNWSKTKAVALVPDLQGYIRINLKGREAQGLIEPGLEYDSLCEQIIDGLKQFVDADTGEPVVAEARRMDAICAGHADLAHLPDIAINWTKTPCATHRRLDSPFGSVPWPTPGLDFDGRSGNHRACGFVWLRGAGLTPASLLPEVDTIDLAPTLYELFGLAIPAHMRGESLLRRLERN